MLHREHVKFKSVSISPQGMKESLKVSEQKIIILQNVLGLVAECGQIKGRRSTLVDQMSVFAFILLEKNKCLNSRSGSKNRN